MSHKAYNVTEMFIAETLDARCLFVPYPFSIYPLEEDMGILEEDIDRTSARGRGPEGEQSP